MAYHILNQFDDQWFATGAEENESSRGGGLFQGWNEVSVSYSDSRRSCFSFRQWFIVVMLLLIAASSLYIAVDARRQTTELQQQMRELRTQIRK